LIFSAAKPSEKDKCYLGFSNGDIYELDIKANNKPE
jgi:hypothetical protein